MTSIIPVSYTHLALGFQAFILRYSVAPSVFPRALAELAYSVALVRERAEEWHVDPHRITVGGFSAGGHLACSLGVFWKENFLSSILKRETALWRPNSLMLCYPVITSGEFAHQGSFVNLLGDRYEQFLNRVSLETQIDENVPPTFLWHTYEDETVPVENSLMLAWALKRHNIPLEMHIYQHGGHGPVSYTHLDVYKRQCQECVYVPIDDDILQHAKQKILGVYESEFE